MSKNLVKTARNALLGRVSMEPKFHRSLSMTFVEDIGTARNLFGVDVAPPSVLLRTNGAAELFGSVKGVTASTLASLAYDMYDPKAKLSEMEFGLDWSVYNGTWRYHMLNDYAIAKIRYIISRMGQSWGYEDPTFINHMLKLEEYNPQIARMGYPVIYPGQPIDPQVTKMIGIYQKLLDQGGSLLPADAKLPSVWADLELHHGQTPKVIWEKMYRYIETWRAKTGLDMGVYTGMWFILAYAMPIPQWFLDGVYKWFAQYNNPTYGERETLTAYPEDADPAYIAIHQTGSYFDALKMGAVGDGNVRTDGNRFNPLGALPFTYDEAVGVAEVIPPPPFPDDGEWVSKSDFIAYRVAIETELSLMSDRIASVNADALGVDELIDLLRQL